MVGINGIYITAQQRTSVHIEHRYNGGEMFDYTMEEGQVGGQDYGHHMKIPI